MSTRLVVLVAGLFALAARAELPQLAVSGGWSNQVFADRAFDLVGTTDAVQQGRVAAAVGFPFSAGVLDVGLAFATGGVNNTTHATVPVGFELKNLQLSAAYRVPIFSWLQPYLELGGGLDWVTLTLLDETRLTQTVLGGAGQGLLGVQLAVRLGRAGPRRVPTLVFDLGAGMVLRPATRFDALGPAAPDQKPVDPIASNTVNVGSMALSGFTSRIVIGLRY